MHAKVLQVIDPVRLVVCLGPSKSASESWYGLTARIKAVSPRRRSQSVLQSAVAGLGRVHTVMHNSEVVSLLSFGEKEEPRGRQSWAERREGNREARLGVLQETPSKAKES